MALNQVFERCVQLFRDELAFAQFGVRDYTYDELEEETSLYGRALMGLGVKKGDSVCIATPNDEFQYILNIACQKIGAIYAPVNFILQPQQLLECINLTKSSVLFFHPQWTDKIPVVKNHLKYVDHFVQMEIEEEEEKSDNDDYMTFEAFKKLAKGNSHSLPLLDIDDNDTAFIVTTLGTGGIPKAVMTSHRNSCAVEAPIFDRSTTFICTTPFFHASPLFFSTKTLVHGATMIMMENFEPEAFLEAVVNYEASACLLLPVFMETLVEMSEEDDEFLERMKTDLQSLRIIMHAGEKCPDELSKRFGDILPKCWISDVYGITECSGIVSYQTRGEQLDDYHIKSVGSVVPFHLLRICDPDTGKVIPPGKEELGEIQIKGPAVFKGFYENPGKTAKVMTTDGYFKTGDRGYLDAQQRLYIKGRVGEEIVESDSDEGSLSGSESDGESKIDEDSETEDDITVYDQTDQHLKKHKYVDRCISISIPLSHYGKKTEEEQIESFVVTKRNKATSKRKLQKFLKKECHLDKIYMPTEFHFVSELPEFDSGKVDVQTLRRRFFDGTLGLP